MSDNLVDKEVSKIPAAVEKTPPSLLDKLLGKFDAFMKVVRLDFLKRKAGNKDNLILESDAYDTNEGQALMQTPEVNELLGSRLEQRLRSSL